MASDKQIKANRENAQRSTGPKNTDNSKHNAEKHGFRGRRLLTSWEDPADFKALHDSVKASFPGLTGYEDVILERLIEKLWELNRFSTIKTGLFETLMGDTPDGSDSPLETLLLLEKKLCLMERYETSVERSVYKLRRELTSIRHDREYKADRILKDGDMVIRGWHDMTAIGKQSTFYEIMERSHLHMSEIERRFWKMIHEIDRSKPTLRNGYHGYPGEALPKQPQYKNLDEVLACLRAEYEGTPFDEEQVVRDFVTVYLRQPYDEAMGQLAEFTQAQAQTGSEAEEVAMAEADTKALEEAEAQAQAEAEFDAVMNDEAFIDPLWAQEAATTESEDAPEDPDV